MFELLFLTSSWLSTVPLFPLFLFHLFPMWNLKFFFWWFCSTFLVHFCFFINLWTDSALGSFHVLLPTWSFSSKSATSHGSHKAFWEVAYIFFSDYKSIWLNIRPDDKLKIVLLELLTCCKHIPILALCSELNRGPPKTYSSPTPQYLWRWLYLEIGCLQI